MLISAAEQAIVNRLAARLTDPMQTGEDAEAVEIRAWPENPDEYRLIHPIGAVLVRYKGSRWSPPETLGAVVQTRTAEFELAVIVRSLRDRQGHLGGYTLLDSVRLVLTGYGLPGAMTPLYLVREDLVSRKANNWLYAQTFACRARTIEVGDLEQPVLLKKMTFNDTVTGDATVVEAPSE